jgi:hypothetical protein
VISAEVALGGGHSFASSFTTQRETRMRAVLRASFVAFLLAGCTMSEPYSPADSGLANAVDPNGTAGAGPTVGGGAGSGGGGAGTNGGQAGTGQSGGQAGAAAGVSAPAGGGAGTMGGGQAGNAGGQAGNAGGQAGRGADGGVADAGAAPTFTELYTTIFNNTAYASNCAGGACHNPGTQKGLDFSTKAKGYTTALAKIKVGNPTGSQLVSQLASGSMPKTRPRMPAADQAKISAWIAAGAPNN